MEILKFKSFNERFNIDKINIKDVDLGDIVTAVVFPKPGRTIKQSLEDGMICANAKGQFVVVNNEKRQMERDGGRTFLSYMYLNDNLESIHNQDFTIARIWLPIDKVTINSTQNEIASAIQYVKPIWERK